MAMYKRGITKRRSGIRRVAKRTRKSSVSKRVAAARMFRKMVCEPELKMRVQRFDGPVLGSEGNQILAFTGDGVDIDDNIFFGNPNQGIFAFPEQGTDWFQRIGEQIHVKAGTFKMAITTLNTAGPVTIRLIFFTVPRDSTVDPPITGFWKFQQFQQALLGTVNKEIVNVISDRVYQITPPYSGANKTKMIYGTIIKNRKVLFASQSTIPKHSKNKLYFAIMAGGVGLANGTAVARFQAEFKLVYSG